VCALLVAFFDDAAMTPLIKFLRKNGAAGSKQEVLRAANSVQIRKLRRRRDMDGVREATMAEIQRIYPGKRGDEVESCLENGIIEALTLEDAETGDVAEDQETTNVDVDPRMEARVRAAGRKKAIKKAIRNRRMAREEEEDAKDKAPFQPDPSLKALLVEWFDNPEKTITVILTEKDRMEDKKSMQQHAKACGLHRRRKIFSRAEAMRLICGLYSTEEESIVLSEDDDFVTDMGGTDEEMTPVSEGRLLTYVAGPDEEIALSSDGDGARSGGCGSGTVVVRRSDTRQNRVRALLAEWFYDDAHSSVAAFVGARCADPAMRVTVARLIRRLGLRQLRNRNRMIRIRADRRIERAFNKKLHQKLAKNMRKDITKKRVLEAGTEGSSSDSFDEKAPNESNMNHPVDTAAMSNGESV